jgi:uncharacterized protein (TIGR00369 family)
MSGLFLWWEYKPEIIMVNKGHYRKLEKMYASAPCNEYYSPVLTVSNGTAELMIKIREDFFHSAGSVHGSVYFKALDDAAFFAVNSLVDDVLVLTVNFNINLALPVSHGQIKATGKVINASGNLLTADSLLFDSERREIARGSGRFVRSKIKLSSDIGYK